MSFDATYTGVSLSIYKIRFSGELTKQFFTVIASNTSTVLSGKINIKLYGQDENSYTLVQNQIPFNIIAKDTTVIIIIILLSLFNYHFIIILLSFYYHFIIILLSFYYHFIIILLSFYYHFIIILLSFYYHFIIILL